MKAISTQVLPALMRFGGVISVLFLVSSAFPQAGPTIPVYCDQGQSLNGTLSRLNKDLPITILVHGTCTEFVLIDGFENLTINGQSGSAIQQPVTNPHGYFNVISITASQEVTVSGLAVHSPSVSAFGIGSSRQILLQNLNIDGSAGVTVFEQSHVLVTQVNVNITSGFAAIQAYENSDVTIAGGLLTRQSNGDWNVGVFVSSGHVSIQGTTIRDMQLGIGVNGHGGVGIGGGDVTIDNPSGVNFAGANVSDGSSLDVAQGRLLINNAGQPWGDQTGGVFVTNGSTLNANANLLVVSNSHGHGIIVTNNSHATLNASSITGSLHGGLVVANLSTIDVQPSNSLTLVAGNATDLFCDSNSFITGTVNLTGVSTVNCGNQLPNNTVPLP